mmetsp:Transcript_1088/g.2164  ORF Transcript_1088/g.2164 Transcript_1088/m.2164 type:complete len:156 (-) Transcript_1088:1093-1560(-)
MKLLSAHQSKFWLPLTAALLVLLAIQQHIRQHQQKLRHHNQELTSTTAISTLFDKDLTHGSSSSVFENVLVEVSLEKETLSLLRTELVPIEARQRRLIGSTSTNTSTRRKDKKIMTMMSGSSSTKREKGRRKKMMMMGGSSIAREVQTKQAKART